ncbi:MAG: alpha-xylosidase, partial [Prevotella sp.]
MRYNKVLLTTILLTGAMGLSAASFIRQGNFVTVRVERPSSESPRLVRLQVVGDKLIRVEATSENAFPEKHSLIIVPQSSSSTTFNVSDEGRQVQVATTSVKALVDKQSGRVSFYDRASGRRLLAEDAREGKTIRPFVVPEREIGVDSKLTDDQKKGYTWRLLFEDNPGEALYGLGQHQAGELDMKGKNEDLYQYNTKVSVPFVVSNQGYGILWDSYSYCRFGNPEDYLQLNRAFTLYDKDGRQGQLTGTYIAAD